MRHRRRIYLLDNKESASRDCYGFVHKARKKHGDCCACLKSIEKDTKYVRFNYPFMGDDEKLHLDCAVRNWSLDRSERFVILGVKIEKRTRFLISRSYVICERFYPHSSEGKA